MISISLQRRLLQGDNGLWSILSASDRSFLGVASTPDDGTKVVGSRAPTVWDIRPDEEDPSYYR